MESIRNFFWEWWFNQLFFILIFASPSMESVNIHTKFSYEIHSLPVWIHTGIAECSIWILYRNPYGRYSQGYQFFPVNSSPDNSSPIIFPKSNSSQEQFFPKKILPQAILPRTILPGQFFPEQLEISWPIFFEKQSKITHFKDTFYIKKN
jgi:hypothetical protein